MTERMFRVLERLQKLDALLGMARMKRFADPFEIARLERKKLRYRGRLVRS